MARTANAKKVQSGAVISDSALSLLGSAAAISVDVGLGVTAVATRSVENVPVALFSAGGSFIGAAAFLLALAQALKPEGGRRFSHPEMAGLNMLGKVIAVACNIPLLFRGAGNLAVEGAGVGGVNLMMLGGAGLLMLMMLATLPLALLVCVVAITSRSSDAQEEEQMLLGQRSHEGGSPAP